MSEENENAVNAGIQSRRVSAYNICALFSTMIIWWNHSTGAQIKAGLRVVGCCAHITSVVWYFAFRWYQQKDTQGVRHYAVHLEDAVRVIDESDSDQESGPDIYKNNIYIFSRSFQRKICFLTITQMFLNGIDFYLEH